MKKLLSFFLVSTFFFTLIAPIPVKGAEISESKLETVIPVKTEEEIEEEIKAELELARKDIYMQLEKQNALILMKTYEDIIYPSIEKEIRDKYANNKMNNIIETRGSYSYYAPEGGMITYLSELDGYKPTEVVITCLNRNDSYDYLLLNKRFSVNDVCNAILGYIPYIGSVTDIVMRIKALADQSSLDKVYKAGGCMKIISTYSREWGTKASILTGWNDRFYINISLDNATNITTSRFHYEEETRIRR
ncbi:hypothetical protein HF846_03245 [Clostridium cadaveris]|uniref:hypothetical protein n=1 Tax=Clostridium cadaveris TaxID=1529 RepID=UPI001459A12D|nr:hypothetical protein [Clostridium cadaveris]NME63614.1 hypothetical protein [Clostridium cadaveris]